MQNIQERLTVLWPATRASSRRIARFAVSISASLTAGFTTSVDMGKRIFKKITDFPRVVPHFFFLRNLTCLSNNSDGRIWAFYSTYSTLDRDNPGIENSVRKLLFLQKWTLSLSGPHI